MNGGKTFHSIEPSPGERRVLGEGPPGWSSTQHCAVTDSRVSEMRALLARMRPVSDSEALQCLRRAFPESTLAARVAAMATSRG